MSEFTAICFRIKQCKCLRLAHFYTRENSNKRREFSRADEQVLARGKKFAKKTRRLWGETVLKTNMNESSETPKKPCNANIKICRCCNSSLLNYYDRIDLFGKTSIKENLLQKLNEIGKIEVCERDEDFLPTKICRKCYRKITGLAKSIVDFSRFYCT